MLSFARVVWWTGYVQKAVKNTDKQIFSLGILLDYVWL